jgi:hypothetical protein
MKQDLTNPALFGNDAGEDESLDVLNSYFLFKPEFKQFFDENVRLAFVRSRKGIGKSALLRQLQFNRQQANVGEVILYVKASDLMALQEIDSSTPSALIYGWQQRICTQVNLELGQILKVALTDDTMTLVESAELAGFRGRNLVGSLLDRLKLKVKDFEISRQRVEPGNAQALLQRILAKQGISVWLLIDDIDAMFLNTEAEKLRVSAFFSACRNIVQNVSGLNLRASVRTDVWSILAQYDESLDKCEQYMLDLSWSTAESGQILEKRIASFQIRTYGLLASNIDTFDLVFRQPFIWAGRRLEAYRPIHILSAGRPRWATQLCRMSGKRASEVGKDKIGVGDVEFVLRDYGAYRLSDLYKEHRHQCPQIEHVLEAFSGGPAQFTTAELLEKIRKDIITKSTKIEIDGSGAGASNLSLAHFLFRIGFINARNERAQTGLDFVRFEERPNLLSTLVNADDELPWEIHPSYRTTLSIRQPKKALFPEKNQARGANKRHTGRGARPGSS